MNLIQSSQVEIRFQTAPECGIWYSLAVYFSFTSTLSNARDNDAKRARFWLFGDSAIAFGQIKRVDHEGNEFWSARDRMPLLDCSGWQKFKAVLLKAQIACENSGNMIPMSIEHLLKKNCAVTEFRVKLMPIRFISRPALSCVGRFKN